MNDIKDIVWNSSFFDNLAILAAKKKIITALAKAHIFSAFNGVFNDLIKEKSQGLITLLQYEIRRLISYHRLIHVQWTLWSGQDPDRRRTVEIS